MRAILVDNPGPESRLRIADVAPPEMRPAEIRIRVTAAGVNRADLLQRRGLYPPPPGASAILGLECAGTVLEVGAEVDRFRPGDRVMALLPGGGYAEQATVDARCALPIPETMTDIEAAAIPEVFVTAFLNLVRLGGLVRGATALVHGGSGGVGTAAIQVAAEAGARVLVTAGSDERCRRCLDLGAASASNHRTGDFVADVLAATAGAGVDLILDCLGASYLDRNLRLLRPDGRLVLIGLMGGSTASIELAPLLARRLSIVGSTLRSRSAADKGAIIDAFVADFGVALETGRLWPVVDRSLPLEAAEDGHRAFADGEIFGKLVLTLR